MDIVRPAAEGGVADCKTIVELRRFGVFGADAINDFVVVCVAEMNLVWSDANDGTLPCQDELQDGDFKYRIVHASPEFFCSMCYSL